MGATYVAAACHGNSLQKFEATETSLARHCLLLHRELPNQPFFAAAGVWSPSRNELGAGGATVAVASRMVPFFCDVGAFRGQNSAVSREGGGGKKSRQPETRTNLTKKKTLRSKKTRRMETQTKSCCLCWQQGQGLAPAPPQKKTIEKKSSQSFCLPSERFRKKYSDNYGRCLLLPSSPPPQLRDAHQLLLSPPRLASSPLSPPSS